MKCSNCNGNNDDAARKCVWCNGVLEHQSSNVLPPRRKYSQLKEYKVMSQKDRWFTSNFDADAIENALNQLAKQGWQLVTVTTQRFGGIGNSRDEIFFFLERDLS